MKKENIWRMVRALLDGGVQWLAVGGCLMLSHVLLKNAEFLRPGGKSKLPQLAQWVGSVIPQDQTARFFLFLLPGLVWCAWFRNPDRMEVITRISTCIGLFAIGSASLGFLSYHGVLSTEPESSMFQIDSAGEVVFVILCLAPLIIAALTHFHRSDD